MEASQDLTLADALGSLRDQLEDAVAQAQGANLSFVCQSVNVELHVTVANTTKGSAKVGLWNVVTIGGGAERASTAVHVVKLTLRPELRGSGKIRISDED